MTSGDAPRLRVLCPVLNEATGLQDFLNYLKGLGADGGLPVEFCVVDAGSSDGSREILGRGASRTDSGEKFGFDVVLGTLPSPSVARTLNLGLSGLGPRDFVLVHPVDCRIPAAAWRVLIEELETACQHAADHRFDFWVFQKAYFPQGPVLRAYAWLLNEFLLALGNCWVWTHLPCFRISLLSGVTDGSRAGFPELGFLEDLEFGRSLRKQGRRMRILPAFVSVSSRRYARDGQLRRILFNGLITLLFLSGIRSHQRLKSIFYRD
jgi:hypothetical protein